MKGTTTMFASIRSRLPQIRYRLPRVAVQAAGALAMVGMILSSVPHAAEAAAAAPGDLSYRLNFTRLECVHESGEIGSDEPYVVFFIGDLSNPAGGSYVRHTNVFGSVDTGDDRFETVHLWSRAGGAAVMPGHNPDNLIVLAQIVEHDSSSVSAIVNKLQSEMPVQLALYKAAGLTRSQIVSALKGDMFDYINQTADATASNQDDMVGRPVELRITAANLAAAATGTPIDKTLQVNDGGDGSYRMYFELRKA
jgi:hypothetical protein